MIDHRQSLKNRHRVPLPTPPHSPVSALKQKAHSLHVNNEILEDVIEQSDLQKDAKVPSHHGRVHPSKAIEVSLLDSSKLFEGKESLRGALGLFYVLCIYTIGISLHKGIEGVLFHRWLANLSILTTAITGLAIWCYSAWAFHRACKYFFIRKSPLLIRLALQHSGYVFSLLLASHYQWRPLQSAFCLIVSISFGMKMHAFLYYTTFVETTSIISFYQFSLFLLEPTYVFNLKHPRKSGRSWSFAFRHSVEAVLLSLTTYCIIETYIIPPFEADLGYFDTVIEVALPFTALIIVVFFLIWEAILNLLAELTYLVEREFYQDWYNLTGFSQFARKWNTVVHRYLHHYLYTDLHRHYGLSKMQAKVITFAYSSLLHEMFLSGATRKLRCYVFFSQFLQLPLIWMAHNISLFAIVPPILGNVFWWFFTILGVPAILVLYDKF